MVEARESNGIRLVSADKDDFIPSTGLTTQQAEDLLKVHGPNELPENKVPMVGFRLHLYCRSPRFIWILT